MRYGKKSFLKFTLSFTHTLEICVFHQHIKEKISCLCAIDFFKLFMALFITYFKLDTRYLFLHRYQWKRLPKPPWEGFGKKPLQRVFNWVPFSLERSPIYSPTTVNLKNTNWKRTDVPTFTQHKFSSIYIFFKKIHFIVK